MLPGSAEAKSRAVRAAPSKAELTACSRKQFPGQARGAGQTQISPKIRTTPVETPVQREVDLGLSVSAAETRQIILVQFVLQDVRWVIYLRVYWKALPPPCVIPSLLFSVACG